MTGDDDRKLQDSAGCGEIGRHRGGLRRCAQVAGVDTTILCLSTRVVRPPCSPIARYSVSSKKSKASVFRSNYMLRGPLKRDPGGAAVAVAIANELAVNTEEGKGAQE